MQCVWGVAYDRYTFRYIKQKSSGLLEMCQEKIALGGIAQVNTLANQLENNKSVDRLEVMLR